jgi:hypothetical protein
MVMFDHPVTVAEAVAKAPVHANALGWGIQSMVVQTVRSMVLLAAARSEHYRYALGVTGGIGQYLYDLPEGAITNPDHFKRTDQVETLIGHFDNLEVHVIQELTPEEEQGLMLMVLDDDKLVVGYLYSQLREYGDHININNILPKTKS